MSAYFFQQHLPSHHHHNNHHNTHHHHNHPQPPSSLGGASGGSHHHHQQHHPGSGGRSRRGAKMGSQTSQKQFRGVKSMRELTEAPAITAFRARFEAGRSFDLDDDLEFCPGLLTEDDLHSIQSSASDRSSLASISPDSSPLQNQIQPAQHAAPSISLSPASMQSYATAGGMSNAALNAQSKVLQPAAVRTRNAIPIVNPSTGMRVSSPPSNMSPSMAPDQRRW